MADGPRNDGPKTGTHSAAPHVRPARIFRTLVMCALAAAPPLGCGSSGAGAEDQQHGRVYRGGAESDAGPAPQDVAAVPAYGINTPDYAVEPPPPMPEYAAPGPEPVPAYGVPEPVVMYGGPGM